MRLAGRVCIRRRRRARRGGSEGKVFLEESGTVAMAMKAYDCSREV
jgi:hypothetical protein